MIEAAKYHQTFKSGYLAEAVPQIDSKIQKIIQVPDFKETFGYPVKTFDTIVLSDIHLGSNMCRSLELFELLKTVNFKRLIINGDVFDSINMKRLNRYHWRLLSLLRQITDQENQREVIWIRGNHDGFSDLLSQLLGVSFRDEYLFTWNNKKVLTLHGDIFDVFSAKYPIVADIASGIYYAILLVKPFRQGVGRFLKHKSKTFLRNIEKVRDSAINYARHFQADMVICGHTHHVDYINKDGVEYFNPGSWTDIPGHFVGFTENDVKIVPFR